MSKRADCWISVDTETSGATPHTGSLISIGACVVDRPEEGFYVELKPDPAVPWSPEAEAVHRLSRAHLAEHGVDPHEAMTRFEAWIAGLDEVRAGAKPLFVGFNTPFDWMHVADAFWRYLGRNPFGISGHDLKSFYLGRHWGQVTTWGETAKRNVRKRYPTPPGVSHTHNALDDAREQAQLANAMRGGRR